jgi:arginyl-tRNA synthetase
MKSLLNKANDLKQEKMSKINSLTEEDIALTVLNLTNVLDKALEVKSLNDIAEYLYKLTSLYNKFYAENKVLTEENSTLQESWLVLTKIVHKVNSLLLDVLAIEVPEKM